MANVSMKVVIIFKGAKTIFRWGKMPPLPGEMPKNLWKYSLRDNVLVTCNARGLHWTSWPATCASGEMSCVHVCVCVCVCVEGAAVSSQGEAFGVHCQHLLQTSRGERVCHCELLLTTKLPLFSELCPLQ